MNIVDSSGWLEYLADGPNSKYFEAPLKKLDGLIVPTIIIYEVFKSVLKQRGEDAALQTYSLMIQAVTADLDSSIAISASKLSVEYKIPMADSIILATARKHDATIWTQDSDFENIPNVRFFRKQKI